MFDRQPDHRNHVGHNQDQVLRHLGPGHRPHASQERADQNAGKTHINAHIEGQTSQTGSNQTNTKDLCDHVNKRHEDGGKHTNQSRHVAAVARTKEVRNGELAELAQVGRQEQGHQAVAAGPAQNEGQTAVASEVQGSGHTNERRCRHPVGAGGHAVVHGRHTTARNVVLCGVVGATHHADAAIQQHSGSQEGIADVLLGHPYLLEDGQYDHEARKAPAVPNEYLVQGTFKLALGLASATKNAHSDSPSATPYSLSRLFM